MAEETIILNVEIDQGQAIRDLEKIEAVILDNKDAQKELQKAYKDGTITQKEYIQENLRLQGNLKKEQDQKRILTKAIDTESNSRNALKLRVSQLTAEYDNLNTASAAGAKRADELQKELSQLNDQISKSSKSAGLFKDQIGNYPSQFGEAAKSINVAGLSVGDIGSKLTSFLNPATAAVGIVGALGAAYAKSAVGARDLEFASFQLSAATQIAADAFGSLFQLEGQGEGFFSALTYGFLSRVSPALADLSLIQAQAERTIKQLEISRAFAAGFAKEDERRAELYRRLRDDEANATARGLQARLAAAEKIDPILENSAKRTIIVIQAQIAAIKNSTNSYDLNLEAQLKVAQLEAEIADKQEEITGKLTENVAARARLNEQLKEQAFLEKQLSRKNISVGDAQQLDETTKFNLSLQEIGETAQRRQMKLEKDTTKFLKEQSDKRIAFTKAVLAAEQARLEGAKDVFAALSGLFEQGSEEQKAFALSAIAIDTAQAISSLTAASEANPLNSVTFSAAGIAQFAAGLVRIISNVASAKSLIGFAEGGYTGHGGKHDVAGVVHKGEYVVPQSVNYSAKAQPHIRALEGMRTGSYAEGGFVATQMTAPSQQALIMANALKSMPIPEISVKEVTQVQRRIKVKENISSTSKRNRV